MVYLRLLVAKIRDTRHPGFPELESTPGRRSGSIRPADGATQRFVPRAFGRAECVATASGFALNIHDSARPMSRCSSNEIAAHIPWRTFRQCQVRLCFSWPQETAREREGREVSTFSPEGRGGPRRRDLHVSHDSLMILCPVPITRHLARHSAPSSRNSTGCSLRCRTSSRDSDRSARSFPTCSSHGRPSSSTCCAARAWNFLSRFSICTWTWPRGGALDVDMTHVLCRLQFMHFAAFIALQVATSYACTGR